MLKRNEHFGFFHVYNRGVDKRDIFIDDCDRYKFLNCLTKLNNGNGRIFVKILAYCLMDNHFHLLVEQTNESGLAKFMHRLGTSYTMSFNKRHKRSGSLFESRYKSKHIKDDRQLFHTFRYIHLNPLKFLNREGDDGTTSIKTAIDFIHSYTWSNIGTLFSYNNSNKKTDLINQEFKSIESYNNFLTDWIKYGTPKLNF